MADTLGTLKAEILDWLEESTMSDNRMNNAVNDAVEAYWTTLVTLNVSLMLKGPVSLSIASGTEGVILVSVVDPTLAPTISEAAAADSNKAEHIVDVAYTYVTESGTETMLSPVTTHTVSQGHLAAVHPPAIATGAIGWNLYCRETLSVGSLVKQNDVPLPFLTVDTVYQNEPENGWLNDPDLPQPPTENTTGDDICYIKHLEAQMPDLGYKAYDAADISSLMMRRSARNIATSSEYQNYYWDLINQRQLEIRPATQIAWTPRYFYVKRPRRMVYDNAPLPFLTVPSIGFLRCRALSRLSISIREFETAKAWEEAAQMELAEAQRLVLQMNTDKHQYITPAF